jgi:hypothetical protein
MEPIFMEWILIMESLIDTIPLLELLRDGLEGLAAHLQEEIAVVHQHLLDLHRDGVQGEVVRRVMVMAISDLVSLEGAFGLTQPIFMPSMQAIAG